MFAFPNCECLEIMKQIRRGAATHCVLDSDVAIASDKDLFFKLVSWTWCGSSNVQITRSM